MCPFFIFFFPKVEEYAILKLESLRRDQVKLCQERIRSRQIVGKSVSGV